MTQQLHPAFAPAWVTPSRLVLGIGPSRITLDDPTEVELDLLEELQRGATQSGLERILARHDAPTTVLRTLLERLSPALGTPQIPLDPTLPQPVPGHLSIDDWEQRHSRRNRARILVDADGETSQPLATALEDLLRHEGAILVDTAHASEDSPSLVVLVTHALPVPRQWERWLREGVPHLPIVTDPDGGVQIAEVVLPGKTPCLWCRISRLAEADHDQVIARLRHHERPRTCLSPTTVSLAAGLGALAAAGALFSQQLPGRHVHPCGTVTTQRSAQFHPDCSCANGPAASGDGPKMETAPAEHSPHSPAN